MPSAESSVGTAVERAESGAVERLDMQSLLALAIEKDGAIEVIERLVELRNREAARQAAQAFHAAFAEFKRRCPRIPRLKRGTGFAGRDGTTQYTWYADLETIQPRVDPILLDVGLSYTWSNEATDKLVTTYCTLRHVDGHAVTSSMVLPISGPPKSSTTQASSGTRSFGKRITLSDVLGLSTSDEHDGAGGDVGEKEAVDEQQLANLEALWDEVKGKMRQGGKLFFDNFGVERLADIPATRYAEAVDMLERKR